MNRARAFRRRARWIAALAIAGASLPAFGQARYIPRYIEPRWFTFRLSECSAGLYAEALFVDSHIDGGSSASYSRTFIGPSIGLNGRGSIYHPNFITYTLITDGAYGRANYHSDGGTTSSDKEDLFLGTISLDLNVLPSKPANGGLFVNYNNTYRDLDDFSRLLVETFSYGARAQFEQGPFLARAFYSHREEDSASRYDTDQSYRYSSKEDTVTLDLAHQRDRGQTSLGYNYNNYLRSDFGQTGDGTSQSINLADSERFDDEGRYQLNANTSYTWVDTAPEGSEEFTATAGFSAEHTPNLSSYYDFGYDRYTIGDYQSDSYNGQASVSHRLYESLTSGASLRGSSFQNTDSFSDGFTRRFGGGISESYVKRLSDEHRLRLEASVFVEHTDQASIGTVLNERHSILPNGEPGSPEPFSFILNQPDVNLLSIVITDETDRPPSYLPGFDYAVRQDGTRTIITWLRPPGPGTPTVVLVDYEAEPTPPGDYETLTQYYLIRFELWRDLLGLYTRVGLSDNNAEEELRVQEYLNVAVGADTRWRNIRAGAEYQIYDSTESDYRTIRLYQSISFRPDEYSTLTLDLNEQWITYQDMDREEQDYRFMARYHRRMTRRLALSLDAGVAYRTGFGTDQLLATFRPAVRYVVGRLSVDAGYDFQQEVYLNEQERVRHMLYVRVKRVW